MVAKVRPYPLHTVVLLKPILRLKKNNPFVVPSEKNTLSFLKERIELHNHSLLIHQKAIRKLSHHVSSYYDSIVNTGDDKPCPLNFCFTKCAQTFVEWVWQFPYQYGLPDASG